MLKGRHPHDEMSERDQLWRELEAMAKRPLSLRVRRDFIRTYKPVLDDEPYRSFDSIAEYREWCEANVPSWLGCGRVGLPRGRTASRLRETAPFVTTATCYFISRPQSPRARPPSLKPREGALT
ncbi:MAG: hypothetical protein ACYC96_11605 [Fimbriimonadaceae bacterium]